MKLLVFSLTLLTTLCASGLQTRNIVLITLDGVRWQEVFSGADKAILNNKSFVENEKATQDRFWANSPERRREKLMPFFWGTIAKEGQLYGNHRIGSTVQLTNREWFSYPGYNEILVGYADPAINSNEKVWNKNVTVLEFLNRQKQFRDKVVAFCSWDVFPYIINSQRSGIPVSAGEDGAVGKNLTERENLLNELISEMPKPFDTVRWDAFTFHLAMEYLQKETPRVIYISFDATDDYAHQGKYDRYLTAANVQDAFMEKLWKFLQSHPFYKNKTTLMISTDHGRGEGDKWTSHGSSVVDADRVWLSVMGPDTPAGGEMRDHPTVYSNQFAASISAFLGIEYSSIHSVGEIIESIFMK